MATIMPSAGGLAAPKADAHSSGKLAVGDSSSTMGATTAFANILQQSTSGSVPKAAPKHSGDAVKSHDKPKKMAETVPHSGNNWPINGLMPPQMPVPQAPAAMAPSTTVQAEKSASVSAGQTNTVSSAVHLNKAVRNTDSTQSGHPAPITAQSLSLTGVQPSPTPNNPALSSMATAQTGGTQGSKNDAKNSSLTTAEATTGIQSDVSSAMGGAVTAVLNKTADRAAVSAEGSNAPVSAHSAVEPDSSALTMVQGGMNGSAALPTGVGAHAAMSEPQITAPLGSPQFSQALGQHLVLMVGSKISSARIHISPAELGPIAVDIQMQQQNQVAVSMVVSHHETHQILQQSLPQLHAVFEAQGMQLQTSLSGGQGNGQQAPTREEWLHNTQAGASGVAVVAPGLAQMARSLSQNSLLDIYA